MIITAIEVQKKNKHRYSLFIDDAFHCGVHEDVLINLGLRKGLEVDQDFLESVLSEERQAKAKSEALHFISYRMRSEKEVYDKLIDLEYDPPTIDRVFDFLNAYNFLDDLAFAKAFISDKSRLNHHSLKKIKYALRLKGVKDPIFDKASLDYLDMDQKNLEKLLPKKYRALDAKHPNDPYILDQKITAFFYQKGFHIEDIKWVLKNHKASLMKAPH